MAYVVCVCVCIYMDGNSYIYEISYELHPKTFSFKLLSIYTPNKKKVQMTFEVNNFGKTFDPLPISN